MDFWGAPVALAIVSATAGWRAAVAMASVVRSPATGPPSTCPTTSPMSAITANISATPLPRKPRVTGHSAHSSMPAPDHQQQPGHRENMGR